VSHYETNPANGPILNTDGVILELRRLNGAVIAKLIVSQNEAPRIWNFGVNGRWDTPTEEEVRS